MKLHITFLIAMIVIWWIGVTTVIGWLVDWVTP